MNLYPALSAKMGIWRYYIAKMKMRELASDVKFASEVYEDRTLADAIQRVLNEGRVKREIVSFLTRRPDRFFASIVVASMGGAPRFYPVRITSDERFQVFVDQDLDQAFGVLTFSGDQKYYALDGQHRLKAIKTLLDRSAPESQDAPKGFSEEEISVLMIVREEEWDAAFIQSYRRLFSSLNRYAKATDKDTNIIMDEDDTFAILTRRIVTEHEFFKWAGRQRESPVVKTKGKNINESDPCFTSLQTLYYMNEELLASKWRENAGWGTGDDHELTRERDLFKRFRPDEEYLDNLHDELTMYWNAILRAIPDLGREPTSMRVHDLQVGDEEDATDHLLFWPIGQEVLARTARRLLNHKLADTRNPNPTEVSDVLKVLGQVDWRLHVPPWRYLILTYDAPRNRWRMRSEGRKEAQKLAQRMLDWMIGLDEYREEDIEDMKLDWRASLVPSQEPESVDQMWEEVAEKRMRITAFHD